MSGNYEIEIVTKDGRRQKIDIRKIGYIKSENLKHGIIVTEDGKEYELEGSIKYWLHRLKNVARNML